MLKKVVWGLLAATLATSGATAADWSGFYAGLQLGGANLTSTITYADTPIATPSLNQASLGGFAGVNFMPSETFLIGLEGDINVKLGTSETVVSGPAIPDGWRTSSPWEGSLRARVGFTPAEGILLYATGGLAAANFTFDNPNCPGCAIWGDDNLMGGNRLGTVVGVGTEVAVTEQVHLKFEYLHGFYGTLHDGPAVGGIDTDISTNAVKVGVSYHF